jgi:hypothetical protein
MTTRHASVSKGYKYAAPSCCTLPGPSQQHSLLRASHPICCGVLLLLVWRHCPGLRLASRPICCRLLLLLLLLLRLVLRPRCWGRASPRLARCLAWHPSGWLLLVWPPLRPIPSHPQASHASCKPKNKQQQVQQQRKSAKSAPAAS